VADPTQTDPDKYKVVLENERVRVLGYRHEPGQRTRHHDHPDSVTVTLSGFDGRLIGEGGETRDVTLEPGLVRWLDAQTHGLMTARRRVSSLCAIRRGPNFLRPRAARRRQPNRLAAGANSLRACTGELAQVIALAAHGSPRLRGTSRARLLDWRTATQR
jgi:beta-alanine degradation protein BauB